MTQYQQEVTLRVVWDDDNGESTAPPVEWNWNELTGETVTVISHGQVCVANARVPRASLMTTGRKYEVIYQIPGVHRVPRRMVAVYLGPLGKSSSFSGRPFFGTTDLENNWIQQVAEVSTNTACITDQKVKS